jgi:hypothetical protein
LNNGETTETEQGQTTATDETSEPVPEPRCDPEKPFGRPFAIAAVNLSDEEENVMVTPDGLTAHIRYGSDASTYVSTRSAVFGDFGTPRADSTFDQVLEDEPSLRLRSITEDGLTVYLSEDWANVQPIRAAHRNTPAESFAQLIVHEELKAFDIALANPWVTPSGDRLYAFLPIGYTLWSAELGEFGFEEPTEVHDGGVTHFTLSRSEQVLYYGATSSTNEGIWRVERASNDGVFAGAQQEDALNSEFHDLPLWVSDDDCEIIFAREGELNGAETEYTSDIFIARRGM